MRGSTNIDMIHRERSLECGRGCTPRATIVFTNKQLCMKVYIETGLLGYAGSKTRAPMFNKLSAQSLSRFEASLRVFLEVLPTVEAY